MGFWNGWTNQSRSTLWVWYDESADTRTGQKKCRENGIESRLTTHSTYSIGPLSAPPSFFLPSHHVKEVSDRKGLQHCCGRPMRFLREQHSCDIARALCRRFLRRSSHWHIHCLGHFFATSTSFLSHCIFHHSIGCSSGWLVLSNYKPTQDDENCPHICLFIFLSPIGRAGQHGHAAIGRIASVGSDRQ